MCWKKLLTEQEELFPSTNKWVTSVQVTFAFIRVITFQNICFLFLGL